jgi:hypothetical protein
MRAIRERVTAAVGEGVLAWNAALLGHPDCHEATMLATFGGRAVDVLADQTLYESFLEEMKHVPFDRRDVTGTARQVLLALARRPWWLLRGGAFVLSRLWRVRRELFARKKTGKITFFIQNFMDADALDEERLAHCSFMVMTDDGPVSMCAHNARRDTYILKPLALPSAGGAGVWDPKTGALALPALPAARAS